MKNFKKHLTGSALKAGKQEVLDPDPDPDSYQARLPKRSEFCRGFILSCVNSEYGLDFLRINPSPLPPLYREQS